MCGTPGYVAPEVLSGKGYGAAVDMWSVGIIVYILLCGFPPFFSDTDVELYRQIREAPVVFPEREDLSQSAKDLVLGLLNRDPEKRLTCDQVLSHEWMTKANTVDIQNYVQPKMRSLIARRRLKRGMWGVLAAQRFSSTVKRIMQHTAKHHSSDDESEPEDASIPVSTLAEVVTSPTTPTSSSATSSSSSSSSTSSSTKVFAFRKTASAIMAALHAKSAWSSKLKVPSGDAKVDDDDDQVPESELATGSNAVELDGSTSVSNGGKRRAVKYGQFLGLGSKRRTPSKPSSSSVGDSASDGTAASTTTTTTSTVLDKNGVEVSAPKRRRLHTTS
eukprot:TRINITY_DN66525_c9_g1_i1.p1 TRINITY_DN66525_c9_g1~~TRINITY_DN66525_c9_g1_i1.p1  ORF type:complete len:390 (-),score=209.31 TRINITY_DN66525_c9_g1_i1:62-1057(-)